MTDMARRWNRFGAAEDGVEDQQEEEHVSRRSLRPYLG